MANQPTTQELLSALQQSATVIQRQKKALAAYQEPIAIIGMGCHYPGGVETPDGFWQRLLAGFDAIGELSAARTVDLGGRSSLPGGFLAEVDQFDPAFFGLSPREVLVMDPAHRLLLETTWEALEAANLIPASLINTEVGVFIGGGTSGYVNYCTDQSSDLYTATGNTASAGAGRISYLLGITGPCVSVDTACSSSLTAIHLACQSLRNGECTAALAGGVNLLIDEAWTTMFANGNMLSADARCKTFDAAANGYVRSEGCGIIVLKRLSDALADGDTIVAVIRGSAVNQDGPSGGLTVPNGPAQERVIRRALDDAKLKPEQIGYIEAHGTGTPLGDPIEIGALSIVFQDRMNPLYVGSAKTNIGHLEMAAGVAGLMKLVLSLQHGTIPPNLHLQTPNPHIDWDSSPVKVPTAATPWPKAADGAPRIGGVSSFGFSGTNAHVIVAEAPMVEQTINDVERSAHLLTIAAKEERALLAYAQRYLDLFAEQPEVDLGDLCYTSHVGRSHYPHRLALTANSAITMQRQLTDYLTNQESNALHDGVVAPRQAPPKVAFLFTGQGSQYVDMGRELYETSPSFRATLDRCEATFEQETGVSLLAVLYPEDGGQWDSGTVNSEQSSVSSFQSPLSSLHSPVSTLLDDTSYTQPALFMLEVALSRLWQSWGIQPDLLIGHSIGELAAACVAGIFSLEDGLKLVAARGRLMGALPQDGEMISLMADSTGSSFEVRVRQAIEPYQNEVSIAAVNGPESIVIAGKRETVLKISEQLAAEGVKTRKLTVSHAFHSPLMEPMLADFAQVAQSITYHQPKIPLVSNITGNLSTDPLSTDSLSHWQYWVRHVREAVRFGDGVETLHEQGIGIFLEIGPKPVLLGMAGQVYDKMRERQDDRISDDSTTHPVIGSSSHPVMLPSLRQGQSDWQQLLESLGGLYVRGVKIDWQGFDKGYHRHKVTLPTYPFQRQRYWVAAPKRKRDGSALRPLIDKMIQSPAIAETLFETAMSVETLPFLADHRVYDTVVAPGACHLAMVLSATELALHQGSYHQPGYALSDVLFPQALAIEGEETRMAQVILKPLPVNGHGPQSEFRLVSFPAGASTIAEEMGTHAVGQVALLHSTTPDDVPALALLQAQCTQPLPLPLASNEVSMADTSPIYFGPTFRWLTEVWSTPSTVAAKDREPKVEILVKLQRPEAVESLQGYLLHPGLLDACFQAAGLGAAQNASGTTLRLPFALESLHLYQPVVGDSWWCHAQQTDEAKWDLHLFDDLGQCLMQLCGFEMRAAPQNAIQGTRVRTDWLYTLTWETSPLAQVQTNQQSGTCWVLFGANTVSKTLAAILATKEGPTFLVDPASSFSLQTAPDANGIRHATVDMTDAEQIKQLFRGVAAQYDTVGVVYLNGLDEPVADSGIPTQSLHLCSGLLHVTQALLGLDLGSELWVVTQGCYPQSTPQLLIDERISSDPALPRAVAAGALWGLGRSIAQEHPRLHCTCIDLGNGDVAECTTQLQQELMNNCTDEWREDQILYVGTERYVARLARQRTTMATNQSQITLSSERSYLITGGLGALGLEVAEQFIANGAQHLILSGRRTTLSTETEARLQQWLAQGVDIRVIQADVSRQTDVERLLAACTTHVPLGGIIHAAGLLDDGLVQNQTVSRFAQVMAPKITGTWLLHTLTQEMDLDFLICFSSVASLLGSPGQSNYAAANAFMDTLMHYRRRQGLPGMSINWGPWAEVGMAAQGETQRRLQQAQVMDPMPLQQARALLPYLILQTVPQIGVFALNFSALAQQIQWRLPLFASLRAQQTATYSTVEPAVSLYAQLEPLSLQARHKQLTTVVRTEVAQVLGITQLEQISVQQPLFELGIDSLMALELKNRLERRLQSTLHSTLVFDYPIIDHLVSYLLEYLFGKPEEANSIQIQQNELSETLVERTAAIEALSDEEAEALLLEKLSNS